MTAAAGHSEGPEDCWPKVARPVPTLVERVALPTTIAVKPLALLHTVFASDLPELRSRKQTSDDVQLEPLEMWIQKVGEQPHETVVRAVQSTKAALAANDPAQRAWELGPFHPAVPQGQLV